LKALGEPFFPDGKANTSFKVSEFQGFKVGWLPLSRFAMKL
jgi:hypothetical protein